MLKIEQVYWPNGRRQTEAEKNSKDIFPYKVERKGLKTIATTTCKPIDPVILNTLRGKRNTP